MAKEEQHSNKTPKILRPKARGSIGVRASGSTSAQFRVRLIPDIKELQKSVSVDELKKQGFTANLPRTVEIVPSTDNSGENSLDVTVYFPKTMREEDVTSAPTSRMLSWIQDTILSKDESDGRWPYVFVKIDGKDVCPV
jgi:tRNA nucleotidyltransferase (CCA-adding enzyme)